MKRNEIRKLNSAQASTTRFGGGTQTIFVNSNTVLYVQSQRRKTEFVCIDRVISCNSSIGTFFRTLYAMVSSRRLPPRMWKWRCFTVCPASEPTLDTMR